MKKMCFRKSLKTAVLLMLMPLCLWWGQAMAADQKAKMEPVYTVLNPESQLPEIDIKALSPRVGTLAGKTIVIYDGRGGNQKPMERLVDQLKSVVPADTKIVYYVPSDVNDVSDRALSKIPDCDAAVIGHGYCGNAAARTATAAAFMEKKGIPAVAIIHDRERASAERTLLIQGVTAVRTVYVSSSQWRDQFPEEALSSLTDALTKPLTEEEMKAGKYSPPVAPRIAMSGTYDEVQEFFIGDISGYIEISPVSRWTDGLPITPPTEEGVARMLSGTSHKPQEIVHARMGAEKRIVTVEKVAINAVMAGCKPEHLPLCLAITANGLWNPWGSSNSLGLTEIVSGPIVRELGMANGRGLMNPGNPANMAIGRFISLALRNLNGSPNRAAYGQQTIGLVLAENPDTPWEGLNERYGFRADESVILELGLKTSVLGAGTGEVTLAGDKPTVQQMLVTTMTTFYPSLGANGRLIVVTPKVAEEWKEKCGWQTMAELQDFLWDNATVSRNVWDRSYWFGSKQPFKDYVAKYGSSERGVRMLNPDHVDLPPDGRTPINPSPENYVVLVAGGGSPDYNQYQAAFAWGTYGNDPKAVSIDAWR